MDQTPVTKDLSITWAQWSHKVWGSPWVLGRKTEKSLRKYSKWDSVTQTYKQPRFVTKTEYQVEREKWYQAQIAWYVKELDELRVANPGPTRIKELEEQNEVLESEVEGLEDEISCLEDELQEAQSEASENLSYKERCEELWNIKDKLNDVPMVLTYVRLAKTDPKFFCDVENLLERIIN